jgi:hypothetical protein
LAPKELEAHVFVLVEFEFNSSAGGLQVSALKLRFREIYNFREGGLATVYKCIEMATKYPVAPAVL